MAKPEQTKETKKQNVSNKRKVSTDKTELLPGEKLENVILSGFHSLEHMDSQGQLRKTDFAVFKTQGGKKVRLGKNLGLSIALIDVDMKKPMDLVRIDDKELSGDRTQAQYEVYQ